MHPAPVRRSTSRYTELMSTYTARPSDIEHQWFIVDAEGMVLGRLATEIARIIRGNPRGAAATLVLAGLFAALAFGTQAFAQNAPQPRPLPGLDNIMRNLTQPSPAQIKPETQFAPGMPADQEFAMRSTIETRLAYVVTGNAEVDGISKAGLQGLTLFLAQRTALEAGDPIGLDIARDELAFFPPVTGG